MRRITIMEILKWAVFAVVIVLIVRMRAGGKISETPFETMSEAVVASSDLSAQLEGDRQMIRRLYRLDPDEYDGVVLYYPVTNMGAEELLLVRLSDADQEEAVLAAVESRIAAQKDSFEGYGIEQMEMLEHAVIKSEGNYVLFVSAKDPDPVRRAFEEHLYEGGAS